jgi:hypothetical protein
VYEIDISTNVWIGPDGSNYTDLTLNPEIELLFPSVMKLIKRTTCSAKTLMRRSARATQAMLVKL